MALRFIILKKASSLNPDTVDYELNKFKTYNKFGLKRKYLPTKKQVNKFKENNFWTHNPEQTVFELKDYKACYIAIYKPKDRYIPLVNGSRLDKYPERIQLPGEYENIEDAKVNAIEFVNFFSSLKKNE